jgi:hypothetical protein
MASDTRAKTQFERPVRDLATPRVGIPFVFVIAAIATLAAVIAEPSSAQLPAPGGTAATEVAKMTPMQLAARFNRTCVTYMQVGRCWPPIRTRVVMWVPVAYVETVKKPGETLLRAGPLDALQRVMSSSVGAAGSVGQTRSAYNDNSWETHVYAIPDRLVLAAGLGPLNMVCTPSDANIGPDPAAMPGGASALLNTSACGSAFNVAADRMKGSITSTIGAFGSEMLCTPRPAYLSELDFPDWRTGCRDMTVSNMLSSNAATCATQGVADLAGVGQSFAGLIGEDSCLGAWGPLFPRQMRDVALTPVAASAKTAYRAMHIARKSFGSVDFPVGRDGLMQQVYPSVSACFPPGQHPLPQPPNPMAANVSLDGNYGWVYWRRVTCCVPKAGVPFCPA